jgi:hypothetical protein
VRERNPFRGFERTYECAVDAGAASATCRSENSNLGEDNFCAATVRDPDPVVICMLDRQAPEASGCTLP